MTIKIILKSGRIIRVKCEECIISKNGFDQVVGYELKGVKENKPLYVNWGDISAIVRVLSDEQEDI
jgi:hypothetical protein